MVIPKNPNISEAECIREEYRQGGPERGKIGALRHFHIQHHDGDDDGNHSIRERFKPLLTHLGPLLFGFAGAVCGQANTVLGLNEPDTWTKHRESVQHSSVAMTATLGDTCPEP